MSWQGILPQKTTQPPNIKGSKKGEEMLVVIRNVQDEEFFSKAFVY